MCWPFILLGQCIVVWLKSKMEVDKTSYGAVREKLGRCILYMLVGGNGTVPISVWRGRGMRYTEWRLPGSLQLHTRSMFMLQTDRRPFNGLFSRTTCRVSRRQKALSVLAIQSKKWWVGSSQQCQSTEGKACDSECTITKMWTRILSTV